MQPATELIIEARYNGPRGLGNGGYVAGALAGFIAGDAEVRIQRGFPLDTPLAVVGDGDGGVRCQQGDLLLGTARPARGDLAIPKPPAWDAARDATARFRCIHFSDPRGCFVCSPHRPAGEGLRLHCGPLDPTQDLIVAGLWRPDAALADVPVILVSGTFHLADTARIALQRTPVTLDFFARAAWTDTSGG